MFDFIDTLIKGRAHFDQFGPELYIRVLAYVAVCLVAMLTASRTFHAAFVGASLIYQTTWIFRLFDRPA